MLLLLNGLSLRDFFADKDGLLSRAVKHKERRRFSALYDVLGCALSVKGAFLCPVVTHQQKRETPV